MTAVRRILMVHRYYWPDTAPYGRLLQPLAAGIARTGLKVTLFSSQPFYRRGEAPTRLPARRLEDGVEVIRCMWRSSRPAGIVRRAAADALFLVSLALHLLFRRRYDLVCVSTSPPIAAALVVRALTRVRGSAMIYHVQDVHPEAAVAAGVLRNGTMAGMLRRLDSWTCSTADRMVVLTEDMRQALVDRGIRDGAITVINNSVIPPPDRLRVEHPLTPKPRGAFDVLYAGNLGRYQDLETVVAAAALLRAYPHIRFLVVGVGVLLPRLKQLSNEMNCHSLRFLGNQPQSVLESLMQECDLALVSQLAGLHRYGFPSKTQGYLAAGCRLLAVVDEPSELATMVRSRQLGVVCPPGQPGVIAQAVLELSRQPAWSEKDRSRVRAGAADFSEHILLRRWATIVQQTLPGPRS